MRYLLNDLLVNFYKLIPYNPNQFLLKLNMPAHHPSDNLNVRPKFVFLRISTKYEISLKY